MANGESHCQANTIRGLAIAGPFILYYYTPGRGLIVAERLRFGLECASGMARE